MVRGVRILPDTCSHEEVQLEYVGNRAKPVNERGFGALPKGWEFVIRYSRIFDVLR